MRLRKGEGRPRGEGPRPPKGGGPALGEGPALASREVWLASGGHGLGDEVAVLLAALDVALAHQPEGGDGADQGEDPAQHQDVVHAGEEALASGVRDAGAG